MSCESSLRCAGVLLSLSASIAAIWLAAVAGIASAFGGAGDAPAGATPGPTATSPPPTATSASAAIARRPRRVSSLRSATAALPMDRLHKPHKLHRHDRTEP